MVMDQFAKVVGVGARTPLGLNAPATAAAVRAGITVMAAHPFMVDKTGIPMVVCKDYKLSLNIDGVDRYLALAQPAALEALQPLLTIPGPPKSVSVFISLPEARPGLPDSIDHDFADRFATTLGSEVAIDEIICQSTGHAGGLALLEKTLSSIKSNRNRICLVGGVDSYITPTTLEWLDSTDQLHSEATIWGFCPSEGAGFCLLVSPYAANAFRLSASIDLLAAGSAMENNRIMTDTVCLGEGLSRAFKRTLSMMPNDGLVNHSICDMTGEPYRGDEYGFAMLRSRQWFSEEADFDTPADCWGDMGAASGPLFVILSSFAVQKNYAPGPLTFLWSSSFGGLRASALVHATTLNRNNETHNADPYSRQ